LLKGNTMFILNSRLVAGAALSAALLAGCGGGDDHASNGPAGPPPGPVAQTISDVVGYINSLIATGSDTTEATDVNLLTLAADDGSEPAALP
jgi:hypothetical protein